ncbi:centrosomal AT-AC splicing factor [Chanos chanos]|uniref:Centrosomal AT-AC splicing factor n=1 Tax=Chanos chanos TaxID=29144 RepID=A0A6J2WWN7_CHACN|nr:coiled-coil domain-containing protein 84 [Chanos chanos]
MGAFYCAVCRQTDFSGKRHIYGKSHQSKLKVVIVKFMEKVKEARRTIKNPQVDKYDCSQHDSKFWCYCCGLEVPKHVTNGNLTVLHGGLLEHMSTREHRTNTHKFWWENKADPKLRDKFIITEEETERFKAEVARALEKFEEKEDTLIKQHAALIRSQEQNRLEILKSVLEPDPEPQSSATEGQHSVEQPTSFAGDWGRSFHSRSGGLVEQPGPSTEEPTHSRWTEPGLGLTFIGYQDSSGSGNVHTGGVPPWLQEDPEEERTEQEIGPSLQDFLKHKEQEKLRKLPPNRVGANFDHSSHTDANWLPSFGRVWNNGRRWQSRHQFREEESKTNRRKRRPDSGGKGPKRQKQLSNGDIPHS